MIIEILSLLPPVFENVFDESILGAARKSGLIDVRVHNFRDYGDGRHKTVDDSPFGGGPGMVLKALPLVTCIRDIRKNGQAAPVIGLTPQGIPLTQSILKELVRFSRLVLVCGRYEGFDDRILPEFDLELSLGDFVISGGEFAAMTFVDAISRLIPGTVGRMESVEQDSFFDGLLDHPQFTRPSSWEGKEVPAVLLGGKHKSIEEWRRGQSLNRTAMRRADIFGRVPVSGNDQKIFQETLGDYHLI